MVASSSISRLYSARNRGLQPNPAVLASHLKDWQFDRSESQLIHFFCDPIAALGDEK